MAVVVIAALFGAALVFPWVERVHRAGRRKGYSSRTLGGYVVMRTLVPAFVLMAPFG